MGDFARLPLFVSFQLFISFCHFFSASICWILFKMCIYSSIDTPMMEEQFLPLPAEASDSLPLTLSPPPPQLDSMTTIISLTHSSCPLPLVLIIFVVCFPLSKHLASLGHQPIFAFHLAVQMQRKGCPHPCRPTSLLTTLALASSSSSLCSLPLSQFTLTPAILTYVVLCIFELLFSGSVDHRAHVCSSPASPN